MIVPFGVHARNFPYGTGKPQLLQYLIGSPSVTSRPVEAPLAIPQEQREKGEAGDTYIGLTSDYVKFPEAQEPLFPRRSRKGIHDCWCYNGKTAAWQRTKRGHHG